MLDLTKIPGTLRGRKIMNNSKSKMKPTMHNTLEDEIRHRTKILDAPFTNVFLFSLAWALQLFISKLAFEAGAHPITFLLQNLWVNWFVTAVIVLPVRWKELKDLEGKVLKRIILANTIHFGFGSFFCYAGLALTTATNAGFLVKFSLITTLLIARIILKEKMTISKTCAATVMLIGMYLLSTKAKLIVPKAGDLLILLACVAWSTGDVLIRKVLREKPVSGEIVAFLRPISGFPVILFFVILAPFYPEALQSTFQVDFFSFRFFGYVCLAGVSTAVLTLFLNRSLKIASASYTVMISMMTPVFVAFFAYIFLHERILPIQIIGAVLIIVSGIITHIMKVADRG